MKTLIIAIIIAFVCMTANAEPHCQGFNNHDDKVTIVFTDDEAGDRYSVSDVRFVPSYGMEYSATSVKVSIDAGTANVVLTFPHVTHFSNPKVKLFINGKKAKFKVCQ